MSLILSWIESANVPNHPFPLNNLPYGVFSENQGHPKCGVRIGDMVLDLKAMEREGHIGFEGVFESSSWNDFISLGKEKWTELRQALQKYFHKDAYKKEEIIKLMSKEADVTMHLPIKVAEYTDFYSGRNHAQNVGTMFRGPENALPPNWLHMPIGYNGRASSVVVSGTDIYRPYGQLKGPDFEKPKFLPSRRFDFELEMGAIVGKGSNEPVSVDQADDMIFG